MSERPFTRPDQLAFHLLELIRGGVADREQGVSPTFAEMMLGILDEDDITFALEDMLAFWPRFVLRVLTRARHEHGLDVNPWDLIAEIRDEYKLDPVAAEQLPIMAPLADDAGDE